MTSQLQQRLQTLAVLFIGSLFPGTLLTFTILLLFSNNVPILRFFYIRELCLLYLFWMIIIDRRIAFRGGRPIPFIKELPIWNYVRDYFPAELHIVPELERAKAHSIETAKVVDEPLNHESANQKPKIEPLTNTSESTREDNTDNPIELSKSTDHELVKPLSHPSSDETANMVTGAFDPRYPHIFACHPHGIISISSIINLVLDTNQASSRIGIPYRFLTVSANFILPLWRDLVLACGFISASPSSAAWCLRKGISIFIVVGGALEALDARPGSNDLTLARRKGFVRLSLQYGARLVPVYHFGENELYDQYHNPPGSFLRKIQIMLIRWIGFTLPLFKGRGIFNYRYGFLPHRVPLHTVIGKPIIMPKIINPSSEIIDYYHNLYIEALKQLHNEYSGIYTPTIIDGQKCSIQPQPLRIVG